MESRVLLELAILFLVLQTRLKLGKLFLMRTPLFAIDKTAKNVIDIFSKSPKFYAAWLILSPSLRERYKSIVKHTITRDLLSLNFKRALAKDIIQEGVINVDSEIFKYLKRELYRGDSRRLISDLQEVLEK